MTALDVAVVAIGLVAVVIGVAGTGADSWAALVAGACLVGYVIGVST